MMVLSESEISGLKALQTAGFISRLSAWLHETYPQEAAQAHELEDGIAREIGHLARLRITSEYAVTYAIAGCLLLRSSASTLLPEYHRMLTAERRSQKERSEMFLKAVLDAMNGSND